MKLRLGTLVLAAGSMVPAPGFFPALPTFDALTHIEQKLATVETYVQTALLVANGEWMEAAETGLGGMNLPDGLKKVRERFVDSAQLLRKGLEIKSRLEVLHSQANQIAVAAKAGGMIQAGIRDITPDWLDVTDPWQTVLNGADVVLARAQQNDIKEMQDLQERLLAQHERDMAACAGVSACEAVAINIKNLREPVQLARLVESQCRERARRTAMSAQAQLAAQEKERIAEAERRKTEVDSGGAAAEMENSQAGREMKILMVTEIAAERERAERAIQRDLSNAVELCAFQLPPNIAEVEEILAQSEYAFSDFLNRMAAAEQEARLLEMARSADLGSMLVTGGMTVPDSSP